MHRLLRPTACYDDFTQQSPLRIASSSTSQPPVVVTTFLSFASHRHITSSQPHRQHPRTVRGRTAPLPQSSTTTNDICAAGSECSPCSSFVHRSIHQATTIRTTRRQMLPHFTLCCSDADAPFQLVCAVYSGTRLGPPEEAEQFKTEQQNIVPLPLPPYVSPRCSRQSFLYTT